MKAIVGLGNPGREYSDTRHNIGFVIMDTLADDWGWEFRTKFQGAWAEGKVGDEKISLLKPGTYMNLSGKAVRELAAFYKIPAENLLIVHDDMDLALGKTRLRARGGAGGHNGIRSLLGELGTDDFWRLKIGVGRPPAGWNPADYVLSSFRTEEYSSLDDSVDRACKVIDLWIRGEQEKAMNLFNQ